MRLILNEDAGAFRKGEEFIQLDTMTLGDGRELYLVEHCRTGARDIFFHSRFIPKLLTSEEYARIEELNK